MTVPTDSVSVRAELDRAIADSYALDSFLDDLEAAHRDIAARLDALHPVASRDCSHVGESCFDCTPELFGLLAALDEAQA